MRLLVCLGLISLFVVVPLAHASACDPASQGPESGWLETQATSRSPADAVLPRNVAFFVRADITTRAPLEIEVARGRDGTVYKAVLLRDEPPAGLRLYAPAVPLPGGERFVALVGQGSFQTRNGELETTPPAPELRSANVEHYEGSEGCSGGDGASCGSSTTLRFDVPGNPEVAFYGLYEGESPAQATAASAPSHVSAAGFAYVDEAFARNERYLAVTAFDSAGHEGPKSVPVRITTDEGGCSTGSRSSKGSVASLLVLLALARLTRRTSVPRAA